MHLKRVHFDFMQTLFLIKTSTRCKDHRLRGKNILYVSERERQIDGRMKGLEWLMGCWWADVSFPDVIQLCFIRIIYQNCITVVLPEHVQRSFISFCFNRVNKSVPYYKGNKLLVPKLSPDLNGLYICHASNQYGSFSGSLYVNIHIGESIFVFYRL